MTSIITSIAIVVMAVAIVLMTLRANVADETLEKLEDLVMSKPSAVELEQVRNVAQGSDAEIRAIIRRLEEIAKDINELDERTEADHKNLVDIRQRYVLWREPIVPVCNGGVPWAGEIKCTDDEEAENG